MLSKEDILFITNGDAFAADFIGSFVSYCHLIDDLKDKDKPVDGERLVRESLAFIEQLLLNPWAKERQALLWPLIVTGANAWLDANDWETATDTKKRIASDVLKGGYHEVAWFVAYLCGGWDHLRKVTSKYREFNHDFLKG